VRTSLLSTDLGLTPTRNKGVPVPPAGYGFLRVGSPGASQLVRVRVDGVAPRILIPTGS